MILTEEYLNNLPIISDEELEECMTYEQLWDGVLQDFENDADEIDQSNEQ